MVDNSLQWLEDGLLDSLDTSIDDVNVLAIMAQGGTDEVLLLEGEFTFDDIRDVLDEADYEEDDYRGYELWVGRGVRGIDELAILEEDGYMIIGMTSGAVEDVLKSLGREDRLLLNDNENPLKQVLDRAGQGWFVASRVGCFWDVRGCEAAAYSVRSGEDYTVNLTVALVFGSENRAESAERRIDDVLEDAQDDIRSFDYDEVTAEGEYVVVKSFVDEDDLRPLLSKLRLP